MTINKSSVCLQGCCDDVVPAAYQGADPGADQRDPQGGAQPAHLHGGLHRGQQEGEQVCLQGRPQEVRGVDEGVWLCVDHCTGSESTSELNVHSFVNLV